MKLSETDKQEADLFVKNAHSIWANRRRILCDDRMFFARVPIVSGLAYTGAFREPVLGSYIEWWLVCSESHVGEDLVYHLAGSPMSGTNACLVATPQGESKTYRAADFIRLWGSFLPINRRCSRCNDCEDAYTIREVVEELSKGPGRIIEARL